MSKKTIIALAAVFIGLAAVGVALLVVCVLWPSRHLETDRLAVDWQDTGKPMVVSGVLVDNQDRPVPGVDIHVGIPSAGILVGDTPDSYNGEDVTTDARGRFSVKMGLDKISCLAIRDAGVVMLNNWPWPTNPSCSNGLQFHIRLKPKP